MMKMPIAVLGIDLGKNSCSLVGPDASGAVVLCRRMTREGGSRTSPSCRPAWWRWRRAAGRTSSGERSWVSVTRCG